MSKLLLTRWRESQVQYRKKTALVENSGCAGKICIAPRKQLKKGWLHEQNIPPGLTVAELILATCLEFFWIKGDYKLNFPEMPLKFRRMRFNIHELSAFQELAYVEFAFNYEWHCVTLGWSNSCFPLLSTVRVHFYCYYWKSENLVVTDIGVVSWCVKF